MNSFSIWFTLHPPEGWKKRRKEQIRKEWTQQNAGKGREGYEGEGKDKKSEMMKEGRKEGRL
jgi:hypothetical protein